MYGGSWYARLSLSLLMLAVVFLSGCAKPSERREVVVYTSVDQHYSEPVLEGFEQRTGIRVLAVYDVEAAKTTGPVDRLIAESGRPQADVFWSGEFAQTILLKEKAVLAPYASPSASDLPPSCRDTEDYWTGIAGRARVLIVNTELTEPDARPKSIHDLLDPKWPADRIAMAYPVFGTTATHAAALYATWGPERARSFFENVKARGVQIVPGNSVVRDMVADGRATWGLTDTDDAAAAIARDASVAVVFPDQDETGLGTLLIPNTVALIAGAPHVDEGKALIDYLLSRDTEAQLVRSGWCHVPVRELGVSGKHIQAAAVKRMDVDLVEVYRHIDQAKSELSRIFIE